MTTANIIFLIDIQNGFAKNNLNHEQGGSLYVPEGEKAGAPAARVITLARDAIIVLSADFHPNNIISDMTNHSGVMALRQQQALTLGVEEATLPFTNVYLREGANGQYKAVGVIVDDKVLAVETDQEGYVVKVRDDEEPLLSTDMAQTLWTKHCVRGTQSALYVSEIMNALPKALADRIYRHDLAPTLVHVDEKSQNTFYVIRKGMRRDVDSNAIAVENNHKSFTSALDDFKAIAKTLHQRGVTQVNISLGGLAGNICAELSHNDVCHYLVPLLQEKGIKTNVAFMTDISPNIPITIPDGSFPDAAHSLMRMATYGTEKTTTKDVIRSMVCGAQRRYKRNQVQL